MLKLAALKSLSKTWASHFGRESSFFQLQKSTRIFLDGHSRIFGQRTKSTRLKNDLKLTLSVLCTLVNKSYMHEPVV